MARRGRIELIDPHIYYCDSHICDYNPTYRKKDESWGNLNDLAMILHKVYPELMLAFLFKKRPNIF